MPPTPKTSSELTKIDTMIICVRTLVRRPSRLSPEEHQRDADRDGQTVPLGQEEAQVIGEAEGEDGNSHSEPDHPAQTLRNPMTGCSTMLVKT